MEVNYDVVLTLTIIVIVANAAASIRAFYTAIVTDTTCVWACRRNAKHDGMTILIGFGVICLILAGLKTWSILDVFINHWHEMPKDYHIRAVAYLTENFGVAWLCWRITSFISLISKCPGDLKRRGQKC